MTPQSKPPLTLERDIYFCPRLEDWKEPNKERGWKERRG
jgi:hypothetical protein